MNEMRRLVAVGICCVVFTTAECVWAQADLPQKTIWRMTSGGDFEGSAYDFGYHFCFLQRRLGKLYLNGVKLESAMGRALLVKLCDEKGIDLDDEPALQKKLAREPWAQLVLPFFTLKYHDTSGFDREVPTILLHPDEQALLRPAAQAWQAQKRREHEERLRYVQQQENEQARRQQMQQALAFLQSIEQAAWAQAYHLRSIRSALD